ncbi:MAG: DUF4347 domain-containing protein [Leptolyngbyaceae cyanobacterium]
MNLHVSPQANTILFVDGAIDEYHLLLSGVRPTIKTHLLNPAEDGVRQITRLLKNQYSENSVREIHIVSHGSPSTLYLGNTQLTLDTCDRYAWDLKSWFAQFISQSIHPSTKPSLVLYGCNVAASDAGKVFVNKLSDFTGANVAASKSKMGHSTLGGNWDLDYRTGTMPVSIAFSESTQQTYVGVFGTDGDGVPDLIDIDDDNDGILDTVENENALASVLAAEVSRFRVSDIFQTASGSLEDSTVGSTAVYNLVSPDDTSVVIGKLRATVTNIVSNTGTTTLVWQVSDNLPRIGIRSNDGIQTDTEAVNFRFELFQASENTSSLLAGNAGTLPLDASFTVSIADLDLGSDRTESIATSTSTLTAYTVETPSSLNISTTEIPGSILATGTINNPSDVIEFTYVRQNQFDLELRTTDNQAGFTIDLSGSAIFTDPSRVIVNPLDSDNDGKIDSLDTDSDDDGIPDNIEAQTTAGYVAPSGIGAGITDEDGDGLDDNYDNDTESMDSVVSAGLPPVNTDNTDRLDYLDDDSDNDGALDIEENGFTANSVNPSDLDTDEDGLKDVFEGSNTTDDFDVNDEINDPNPSTLPDADSDVAASGNDATPLINDLDYRDTSPINGFPTATTDTATLNEDDSVDVAILLNDTAGTDGLGSVAVSIDPINGTAVINNNGTPTDPTDDFITFTPNPDFNGTDTMTYTITDSDGDSSTATITFTVNPVDDVPTATNDTSTVDEDNPVNVPVLNNDDFGGDGPGPVTIATPPTNGTVVINDNGTPTDPSDDFITYTPSPDFNGTDTLTYTVTDTDGSTSTATVTFTVNSVDDVPTAADDIYVVNKNTSFTSTVNVNDLLINDTDPDGGVLIVRTNPIAAPSNGTVSLNSDGTFTYLPNRDFTGIDSFVYAIADGKGGTAQATVTLQVSGRRGSGGADFIIGGDGNDIINGLSDFDILDGGAGNDIINGGSEADILRGGAGNDILNGGTDNDEITGGEGNDLASGGTGDDVLIGNEGNDSLNGGRGNDFLRGGLGNDRVHGGAGNDQMQGGRGDDILDGGLGDDILVGADGVDKMTGGQGNDIFLYGAVNEFGDTITDFSVASDRIDLRLVSGISGSSLLLEQSGTSTLVRLLMGGRLHTVATLKAVNASKLQRQNFIAPAIALTNLNTTSAGANGNHIVLGTYTDDLLLGGAGNDQFFSRPGDDIILGGIGNDYASSGRGEDQLFGGDGNDQLFGRFDDDSLFGEAGDDILEGGTGNDALFGASGIDMLTGVDPNIGRGQGEIDVLTGGADSDRLVLGDQRGVFYDDSNVTYRGFSDYARIVGLASQDTIQLAGTLSDYSLIGNTTVNGQAGTGIFWLGDGSATGEFIALVQGTNIINTQAALTFV